MLSGVFLYKNLIVCRFYSFIFSDRFGKLIGTRRIAFATNPCKDRSHFVNVFALDKARNPLQIAAATADKADVVHFVFRVHVKQDLAGTRSSGGICEHNLFTSLLCFFQDQSTSVS